MSRSSTTSEVTYSSNKKLIALCREEKKWKPTVNIRPGGVHFQPIRKIKSQDSDQRKAGGNATMTSDRPEQ